MYQRWTVTLAAGALVLLLVGCTTKPPPPISPTPESPAHSGSPAKQEQVTLLVVGMTKVAAIELANDGVTVNAICPGWVLTPLVEKQLSDRAVRDGTDVEQEKFQFLSEKQPMARRLQRRLPVYRTSPSLR